jgi:hypothetical protein
MNKATRQKVINEEVPDFITPVGQQHSCGVDEDFFEL